MSTVPVLDYRKIEIILKFFLPFYSFHFLGAMKSLYHIRGSMRDLEI